MARSPPSNLSREFIDFLKKMSEVVYRQEEQKLIIKEVQNIKKGFEKSFFTIDEKKELLIRAIYVEMFGFEVPFARIHAINLVQEKSITAKMIGYLACTILIPPNDDIILLLVNTIQKDLTSQNYLQVSAALTSICQLEKKELIQATIPIILEIVDNSMSNPLVKKKAYVALYRFRNYINNFPIITRKCIDQQDINIMFIGLNLLRSLVIDSPGDYIDLVPKLVEILRLIITRQLSQELDYYGTPAPWLQIILLDILSLIGASNADCADHIHGILLSTLKSCDNITKASLAIVVQCIIAISKVQASQSLVEFASNMVSKYITSTNGNLRYMAIVSLSHLVDVNPQCVVKHQLTIVDLINDSDETISRKTLEIVFNMTNEVNVKPIVETLLSSLDSYKDLHYQKNLIAKVALISEKYSPNAEWYLDTLVSLIEKIEILKTNKSQTNELSKIEIDISNQLFQLISSENSDSFKEFCLNKAYYLLDSKSICLQKLSTWTIGEFGDSTSVEHISKHLQKDIATELDGYLLNSLVKLKIRGHNIQCAIGKLNASDFSLAQRIYECRQLLSEEIDHLKYELPEGFEHKTKFLHKIAERALEAGAKPFIIPENFKKRNEFEAPDIEQFYKKMENIAISPTEETPSEEIFNQSFQAERDNKTPCWGPDGYKWSEKSIKNIPEVPNIPIPLKISSVQSEVPKSKENSEEQKLKEKKAAALFGGLTIK